MNNTEQLRKTAQDLIAMADEIEAADNQPIADHNTPPDWVTDNSNRFHLATSVDINMICNTSNPKYKIRLWLNGNLYKTLEEAKAALELLNLDSEIRRFVAFYDKDDPLDWSDPQQKKYYFYWNHKKSEMYFSQKRSWLQDQGTLYMTEQTKDKLLEHFTPEQIERWVKS